MHSRFEKTITLAMLTALASTSFAASVTKETTGTDLTAAASWNPATSTPGSADTAVWTTASLGGTLTLNGATAWQGITIGGATANISITSTGGVLSLGSGGFTLAGTKTFTLANAVEIAADQTWAVGDVTANGNVDAIVSGAITGSGNLIKTGAGRLRFDASMNAFTGKITLNGGVLSYGFNGGTLGSNPGAFVADGITLNGGTINNTASGIVTFSIGANRGVTLGAGGGVFSIDSSSGGVGVTVSSVITGQGMLTKASTGYLALNAANTYTGGTSITGGVVTAAANAAVNIGNGSAFGTGDVTFSNTSTINGLRFTQTLTMANNIALGATSAITNRWIIDPAKTATLSGTVSGGAATSTLEKAGTGTLTISGTLNQIGIVHITAGSLTVTGTVKIGAPGVTVDAGTTLALGGTAGLTSQSALITNAGTVTVAGVLDLGGVFNTYSQSQYTLISGGTVSGGFTTVTGYDTGTFSQVTFDNGVLNFTAVPEPSAYGLIGAGTLAFVASSLRRKTRANRR